MFFENTGWRVTTSRLQIAVLVITSKSYSLSFWIYIVSYLVKNFKKRKKEKGKWVTGSKICKTIYHNTSSTPVITKQPSIPSLHENSPFNLFSQHLSWIRATFQVVQIFLVFKIWVFNHLVFVLFCFAGWLVGW